MRGVIKGIQQQFFKKFSCPWRPAPSAQPPCDSQTVSGETSTLMTAPCSAGVVRREEAAVSGTQEVLSWQPSLIATVQLSTGEVHKYKARSYGQLRSIGNMKSTFTINPLQPGRKCIRRCHCGLRPGGQLRVRLGVGQVPGLVPGHSGGWRQRGPGGVVHRVELDVGYFDLSDDLKYINIR